MIAIIEVPHRLPATLWWATDDEDGLHRAGCDFKTLEDAACYDNNTGFVIRTQAEAADLLKYDVQGAGARPNHTR